MRLEWAVPITGVTVKQFGYDVTGFGLDAVVVSPDEMPRNVGIPMMLCWLLDPDDDIGTSVVFVYEVHGPDGVAGSDILEAFHPPFFEEREASPERIYRPLEVNFNVTRNGPYLVRFGETEDLGATVIERYALPIFVSPCQPDPVVRPE